MMVKVIKNLSTCITAIVLWSSGAFGIERDTPVFSEVFHRVTENEFSPNGFNYRTSFTIPTSGIPEDGAFVYRCEDGEFLHYVNVMGFGTQNSPISIGGPGDEITVTILINGVTTDYDLVVSESGLSFGGGDTEFLDWSLRAFLTPGHVTFSMRFPVTPTNEYQSQRFYILDEDRQKFIETALACGIISLSER